MNKTSDLKWSFHCSIYELFYTLIHISPAPQYFYLIFWLIGWIILFLHLVLFIFSKSDIPQLVEVFQSFNIWTYIQNELYLKIISYSIFGISQAAITIGLILCLKCSRIRTNKDEIILTKKTHYRAFFKLFHVFLMLSSTILIQIETSLLVYTINALNFPDELPSYKNVMKISLMSNTENIFLVTVNGFTFCELIGLSLIHIFFCQDRSILKSFFWSPNTVYCDILLLLMQVTSAIYFIIINDVFFNKRIFY